MKAGDIIRTTSHLPRIPGEPRPLSIVVYPILLLLLLLVIIIVMLEIQQQLNTVCLIELQFNVVGYFYHNYTPQYSILSTSKGRGCASRRSAAQLYPDKLYRSCAWGRCQVGRECVSLCLWEDICIIYSIFYLFTM